MQQNYNNQLWNYSEILTVQHLDCQVVVFFLVSSAHFDLFLPFCIFQV